MDWLLGFLLVLVVILIVIVVGLIGYGIFYAINFWFVATHSAVGEVVKVSYEQGHSEVYFNVALKIPMTRWVPDVWHLGIKTAYGFDWMSIYHAPANWQTAGKHVEAEYRLGRFDGSFEIVSISATLR